MTHSRKGSKAPTLLFFVLASLSGLIGTGCSSEQQAGAATEPQAGQGEAFIEDSKVIQTAQCAHAALLAGDGPGWDAAMLALRSRHDVMEPQAAQAIKESQVIRAVMLGKKTLEAANVTSAASATQWYKSNCSAG